MRMSQSLLKCCPNCEYSLTGLPDRARCPECGFLYDRRSQVFRQAGARAILIIGAGCGFIALSVVAGLLERGLGAECWSLIVVGLTMVLGQWAFVRGKRNKQVAFEIGTSERTVKAHRHSVMAKLNAHSLAEVVSIAEKLGMVESAESRPAKSV